MRSLRARLKRLEWHSAQVVPERVRSDAEMVAEMLADLEAFMRGEVDPAPRHQEPVDPETQAMLDDLLDEIERHAQAKRLFAGKRLSDARPSSYHCHSRPPGAGGGAC